jgi:3-hydroxymyristoyl/3-hydroxydecanoyl-(acyl carrier protein) dehydratase
MFELIRSLRLDPDRAIGTAQIEANHPMLLDHFHDRPVLPGSWLIEFAAQIAGPLVEATVLACDAVERCALLAMVERAKFLAPVELPAVIRIEATIARRDGATMTARTVTHHGERVVARADLVFAVLAPPVGSEAAACARHDRLARWLAAP